MGGIFAVVVKLALPNTLRRCPPETIALEKCPGFVVRLAVELELNTHCFGVLPVGVAVVFILHGLCGLGCFQLCNTILCPLDAGIAALQHIGRIRAAIESQRRTDAENVVVFEPCTFLGGNTGAAIKRFVLAIVGIRVFHGLVSSLELVELCAEIIQHFGIIRFNSQRVGTLEHIQIVVCLAEVLHVLVPRRNLLFLLAGREVASAADQHGRAPGADLVVPVDGFSQNGTIPVIQVFGALPLFIRGTFCLDLFQNRGGFGALGVVAGRCAALYIVGERRQLFCNAGVAPYIITEIGDMDSPEGDTPMEVDVTMYICAYDTGLKRQGYRDVLNIATDIMKGFRAVPRFGRACTVQGKIHAQMSKDDYHPYYFGAVQMTCTVPNADPATDPEIEDMV